MAILMMMEGPGVTPEQYHGLNEAMGIRGDEDAPDGLVSHVAGHDGENLVVADVWESQEQLDKFFHDRLGPALQEVGVDAPQPRIHPVHDITPGTGTEAGVIAIIDVPGFGVDTYDQMRSTMPAHQPNGPGHPAVSHIAATTDDGILVVDVWESPAAFGKFAEEQVGPAGAAAGIGPLEPRFVPVIGRLAPQG